MSNAQLNAPARASSRRWQLEAETAPAPLPPSACRAWMLYGAVFLLYTALACVTLSTLLPRFTTVVPGGKDSDYYQFLWGYWWIGHALQNGQSPLWTDYTLYPHLNNLSIHTLAPIWYPVYAVAEPLVGTIGAGNLMVLLGFPITGILMFAWLRRRLRGRLTALAFVGGLVYAFSPYMMTHASYIQLNLTPLWWFPLILLLWDELVFPERLPRGITAALLGLALWGVWLTDLQYLVWLALAAWGYALWTLWAARRRLLPVLACGALAAVIMALLAWVYPLAALSQVNLNPLEYPPAGLTTLHAYSVPLSALVGLAPNVETRTLGHVLAWLIWAGVVAALIEGYRHRRRVGAQHAAPLRQSEIWAGQPVSHPVGATRASPLQQPQIQTSATLQPVSPLQTPPTEQVATAHSIPHPSVWFWLAMGLVPLVLALGPDITLGETTLPLPYMLLHNLLKGQHRIPGRLTGPAAFLLITFLALAWAPWLERWWARRRAFAVAGLALAGTAVMADVGALSPFPTRDIPDYPIYHQIAGDKRDFVVMDVPVGTQYGWTGIGDGYFSMFYGAIHQHKMVNGWLARIPYSTLDYYIQSPLFSWLAGTRDASPTDQQQAADELARDRQAWPIGYLIAYRNWIATDKQSAWIGWLNMQPGFCAPEQSADAALIWWKAQTLGCEDAPTTRIDTGDNWTAFGTGWYNPETIGGPAGRWATQDAALRVSLKPNTAYRLTFSALAFGSPQEVQFGGGPRLRLSDRDWTQYTVTLLPNIAPDGLLRLHHHAKQSAASLGTSDDARPLSAAYTDFVFEEVR
jgi:hypothetical protein